VRSAQAAPAALAAEANVISTKKRAVLPPRPNNSLQILCVLIAVVALTTVRLGAAGEDKYVGDCSVLEFDAFDTPPSLQSAPIAKYPGVARLARLSGIVEMRIWVLEDGDVCEVEVLSGPHALLNSSARSAMLRAKYTPALSDSVPVRGIAECSYMFDFVKAGDGKSVFSADSESLFISEHIDRGEAVRVADGVLEYIEFEGVEIRGDMPVDLFRWIKERAGPEVGASGPYVMEVRQVAVREGAAFGNPEPVISVFACVQRLDDGRCNKNNIVEVAKVDGEYVFGHRSVLFTDYTAK